MSLVLLITNILVEIPINEWFTYGALTYPLSFLVNDITNRLFGPESARRIVWIGFVVGILLSFCFGNAGIGMASAISYLLVQLMDVSIFNRLRAMAWFIAPFFSSAISSVADTMLFFGVIFYVGALPHAHIPKLMAGDLAAKSIMLFTLIPIYRILLNLYIKGKAWAPKDA